MITQIHNIMVDSGYSHCSERESGRSMHFLIILIDNWAFSWVKATEIPYLSVTLVLFATLSHFQDLTEAWVRERGQPVRDSPAPIILSVSSCRSFMCRENGVSLHLTHVNSNKNCSASAAVSLFYQCDHLPFIFVSGSTIRMMVNVVLFHVWGWSPCRDSVILGSFYWKNRS